MSRKTRALLESHELVLTEPDDPDAGRPVRSEHRAKMLDLKALANRIAEMPLKVRRALPLDDECQAQFDHLAACAPTPARRRSLMRAKLLLGRVDPHRLEAALQGSTSAAAISETMVYWRTRIVAGGDADIQAFLEQYPAADRQEIRTSAREARGKGPAATRALGRMLDQLRAAAVAPFDSDEPQEADADDISTER